MIRDMRVLQPCRKLCVAIDDGGFLESTRARTDGLDRADGAQQPRDKESTAISTMVSPIQNGGRRGAQHTSLFRFRERG